MNDDAEPSLSIADVSVTEGDSGEKTANFVVSLSAASGQTVTTTFDTSSGTATEGVDFDAASGTVTFEPGQTTRRVVVVVNGDTDVEPDETFDVHLTAPTSASIADGLGVGTIVNDDAVPPSEGVVNTTADHNDGACQQAPGDCTLREAINRANARPGTTRSRSTSRAAE